MTAHQKIETTIGGPVYHANVEQGSDEWHAMRCGLLTASEMKLIITPTLKIASNDKERAHLYELAAQRITRHVEPQWVSDDMLRGMSDEVDARILYSEKREPVQDGGFITNSKWGFTIGYSPDGLVGKPGLIEVKSRRQKYQAQTIIENVAADRCTTIPPDFAIQCQTGLAVSEREWLDFISYCGGMPMVIIRVWPDEKVQNAIIEAAGEFEARLQARLATYHEACAAYGLIPTERRATQEMF